MVSDHYLAALKNVSKKIEVEKKKKKKASSKFHTLDMYYSTSTVLHICMMKWKF